MLPLWKALVTLADEKRGGRNADAAAKRQGWRSSALEVIDFVLAEH
jgi:hypothetical protein